MLDISVIIPVYNVENFISDCLESVIAQNKANIEIICIDDGSTDRSPQILKRYAKRDKRIRIFTQQNSGPAVARNVGLSHAVGKYICFLDSDDMLAPDVLKELLRIANDNNVDFVSYEIGLQYEDEGLYREDKNKYYTKNREYIGVRTGKECFIEMIRNGEYVDSACLLFVDRKWLEKEQIKFVPGIYYEDALFCLKCYMKAMRMCHVSLSAYIYRVRKNSIMTKAPQFDNVYSCLINYRETMRILLDIPREEKELISALIKYMHLIVSKIRYFDDYRIDRNYFPKLSDEDSFLEAVFGVGSWRAEPSQELLFSGLKVIVAQSKGTVLYGAGEVGKLVFKFLCDSGLREKVVCFAVTNLECSGKMLYGKEIKKIDMFVDCPYQIILSAGRGVQKEMKKQLDMLGMQRYIGIDRYTERALKMKWGVETI